MKHLKYITILIVISLFTSSCKKDFLSTSESSSLFRQEYVKDLKTTGEFLNGVSVLLSQFLASNLVYPEIIADNIKPRRSTYVAQYNWSQVADNNSLNMSGVWADGYKIIRSCAFVLEKAEEYKSENIANAGNIQAQAYSIRALVNFFMVNIYAQSYNFAPNASHPGIPYVTDYDWTKPVVRNSVSEVYAGIISDLNNAIPLFENGTFSPLSFNHLAAKALLARVYLFKEDYQLAKNLAREVGIAVPIMTGANYPSKLFTTQESEALFQLAPSSTVAGGTYNTNFQGRFFVGTSSQVQFVAAIDLANLLSSNTMDARKSWITSASVGRTITKYPVNVVPNFNPTSAAYYQTLIRSSEMYLTAAECYAMLGGVHEDSARIYLDYIRQRADPTAIPSTATGADLVDSIRTERRKELAFEGLRMFDLLRWKKSVLRTDPISPAVGSLSYPNDKAIAPIPKQDVDILGLTQNPSY